MEEKTMKISRVALILICMAALFLIAGQASAAQKKLYVYNWSQYMDPAIIKAFEKKYDVEVVRGFFGSNPELFAKLRAGGDRSEEHTSELQSRGHLVCRLLLERKKTEKRTK